MARSDDKSCGVKPHDEHHLYQGSVQAVDVDLDFAARVFRRVNGRPLRDIREDFCGSALMACTWVSRSPQRRAIGIDLDRATIEFARRHEVARLGKAAQRIQLLEADVLHAECRKVEAILALNFSYWVFKTRAALRGYFEAARTGLVGDGFLVLDAFGGTESMGVALDRRPIPAQRLPCGVRLPAYTYVWDQHSFNPANHDFGCAIHFEMKDGTKYKNAFRYDWRFWTLPELQELLLEAGFVRTEVYVDGWDEKKQEGDGKYLRRTRFPHDPVWLGYVVGFRK